MKKHTTGNQILISTDYEIKETIIKGLIHDLNNILTITMGNISLCQLYIEDKDKLNTLFDKSLMSCKRVQELIERLNSITSLKNSSNEIVCIFELIKESISYFGTVVADNIELIKNCKSFNTKADPNQLMDIFKSLIQNALEALEENQKLTIIIENIDLDYQNIEGIKPGYYIKISFKDNGCGISDENIGKIFKKKFTTKENGSGLGLLFCKSLIENNNGYITYSSESTKGCTFNIYLKTVFPIIDSMTPELSVYDNELNIKLKNKKVLIMDDEDKIFGIITDLLESYGIEVDTSTNEEDTIRLYQEAIDSSYPYDLVILDILIMGEPAGIEVIKAIRKLDKNCRVLAMSGSIAHPAILNYSKYGFNNFIRKPFYGDEFIKNVYETIYGN